FTLSQAGMVRHWTRLLRGAAERRAMRRSRAINAVGAVFTGVVLVVVLVTKFAHGAWIVVVAMPALFLLMKGVARHDRRGACRPPPRAGGGGPPPRAARPAAGAPPGH